MDILKQVTLELEKNPMILFAYLYGSVARGEQREDSDIDIAVYLSKHTNDPLLESKIGLELQKKLGKNVDIRVINSASLVFIHQVLNNGQLLFSNDDKCRINFETRKMDEYLDFKPVMEKYDKKRLERYGI
ncbi:MAG: nucleotidyltransferase domain-containing protein [Methanobacteriaceae archaeon]|nr:nucleotidyltransferase domain-containing protein [Methanobacteriaceae archaeon]